MQAARGAPLKPSGQSSPERGSGPRRRHLAIFAAVALTAYAVDLVTKVLVVNTLTGRPPLEVIGGYFSLYLTRNPGAAFSAATSYTEVLTAIAVVAVVTTVWVARRLGSLGWALGLGFLLGGVLGNLTDRVFRSPGPFRGHVVDFFMFSSFPVFNVADIAINIAAATIIVQAVRGVRVDGGAHHEPDTSKDLPG